MRRGPRTFTRSSTHSFRASSRCARVASSDRWSSSSRRRSTPRAGRPASTSCSEPSPANTRSRSTDSTRSALEGRRAALVWSVVPETRPPAWVTGDFLYARFIGDRALTQFDRIQRDARPEIVSMKDLLENEGRAVDTVFAFANNHFMGFGPGTAAVISEVLGEPSPDLGAAGRAPGQSRLDVGHAGPMS